MTIEKLYVIQGKSKEGELLYWNNKTGYSSFIIAEIFTNRTEFVLPLGGKWQRLSDAIIEYSNYLEEI